MYFGLILTENISPNFFDNKCLLKQREELVFWDWFIDNNSFLKIPCPILPL